MKRSALSLIAVIALAGAVDFAQVGWTPDPAWLAANGYEVPPPLAPSKKAGKDAAGMFIPKPMLVVQEQWIEGQKAPILTAW